MFKKLINCIKSFLGLIPVNVTINAEKKEEITYTKVKSVKKVNAKLLEQLLNMKQIPDGNIRVAFTKTPLNDTTIIIAYSKSEPIGWVIKNKSLNHVHVQPHYLQTIIKTELQNRIH
jgi:hypothetical protein